VDVNTPNFKRWFGDGNVAPEVSTADLAEFRENAPARKAKFLVLFSKFRGKTYLNSDTGYEIQVASPKKAKGSPYFEKLAATKKLDWLLENGVKTGQAEDDGTHPDTAMWHYFAAPLKIDGAEKLVRFSVRKTKSGKFYYNHIVREAPVKPSPRPERGGPEASAINNITRKPVNVNGARSSAGSGMAMWRARMAIGNVLPFRCGWYKVYMK
jgi:hypothetical protein